MKYTRTTISIPEHVLEIGQERANSFRLSFSEYLARLVEEEARSKRSQLTIVAEAPGAYATKASLEKAAKAFTKTKKRLAKRKSAA